uniref:Uncharacterized protein n=1 Tax=Arundo donax TaxID=35708 RepID=A0A0A9B826_ARUDO
MWLCHVFAIPISTNCIDITISVTLE